MKYIHYCWFGDKPLPKLAKKCIKSWQKYLPDFEIIKWSEENVDLNECPFIREAYDNKKWAFVADYVRTKVLNEMGGIYFDTDMKITKDISNFFDSNTFLGVEDSGYVAVGVWYENKPNNPLPKELLKYYKKQLHFDVDNIYDYSIPKLITNILYRYGFVMGKNEIQLLKNGITIYPRDYFYPLSYDRQDNVFSDNTCMIHYYDASWIPRYQKIENKIFRIFGKEKGKKIIEICRFLKKLVIKTAKLLLFPIVIKRNYTRKKEHYKNTIRKFEDGIKNIKNNSVLAVYRNEWLGTSYATKEIFNNCLGIDSIYDKNVVDYFAETLVRKKIKLIIFSAFYLSLCKLIEKIKEINTNQKIKVL